MRALLPEVERSTPMPGMKWSAVLEVASIGTRVTGPQLVSLVDLLMTMSLAAQPERNRQSSEAAGRVLGLQRRSPGEPAVGGTAHLDAVVGRVIVVLGVAVPVVRA